MQSDKIVFIFFPPSLRRIIKLFKELRENIIWTNKYIFTLYNMKYCTRENIQNEKDKNSQNIYFIINLKRLPTAFLHDTISIAYVNRVGQTVDTGLGVGSDQLPLLICKLLN